MGFLRRHRSLFFPASNEAAAGSVSVPGPSNGTAAATSLEVPPSPNETKLRRRKSFFEVLGFGKKRASKRQSMSAAVTTKAGQRPRSATVGDYQQQKTGSDVPPVPPLPTLHKKVGNVSAVQLDDLELDDDHMAAITAVVNNSSRDEPPEHLFLSVPNSKEAGSRLSVASKRASTISTRSTTSVNPPQSQAQQPRSTSDSTSNGRQSRRSSLRNSLLVVKDLPDLPSGHPVTPTRARAAPPSSYAPPPESIAQRLQTANVTPELALSAPASTASTPAHSAPSTPTEPHATITAATTQPSESKPEDGPSTAAAAEPTIAPAPAPIPATTAPIESDSAVDETREDVDKAVELSPESEEPSKAAQPIATEEAQSPVDISPPSPTDATPVETTSPAAAEEPEPASSLNTTEKPEPAVDERSPATPESTVDADNAPDIPDDDEPVVAKPENVSAGLEQTPKDHASVPTNKPPAAESGEPNVTSATEKSAELPSLGPAMSLPTSGTYATPPDSPPNGNVATAAAPVVLTPDEEVPDQTWSSSSHHCTPSMLPRTPVGDELSKAPAIASGEESPLLTPQRTGSPVALKQRQVSAPLTPLIREPSDAQEASQKRDGKGERDDKAYATPQASPIGMGHPHVSQRYTALRSVSLPPPRRLSSPPKPLPKEEDPSLDDFVGLMKKVISRDKGMSIREAARAAEQRKSSVPA